MVNQTQTAEAGPAISELHEVRGDFSSSEQMQEAIKRLTASGFDRADLSVPEVGAPVRRSTPESGAMEADTEDDARQARTLHTSTAAPLRRCRRRHHSRNGRRRCARGGRGGRCRLGGRRRHYAVSSAANDQEQAELDVRASTGRLILRCALPPRQSVPRLRRFCAGPAQRICRCRNSRLTPASPTA